MRVLFCAQDAGGLNAILPIFRKMRDGAETTILAAGPAARLLAVQGLAHQRCDHLTPTGLQRAFDRLRPNVVALGASADPAAIERKVSLLARRAGVPTLSVIDHWCDYARRYSSAKDPADLTQMTDLIAVVDRRMRRECVAAGLPAERIRVTGSAHLQDCARRLSAKREKRQILFISQPLSSLRRGRLPFDESSTLGDLLAYERMDCLGKIVVKLHPLDDPRKFERWRRAGRIRVAGRDADLRPLIAASRLIIGMDSMVLLEAAAAGKQVISYQPGLAPKAGLLRSRRIRRIYSAERLYRCLDRFARLPRKKTLPPKRRPGDDPSLRIAKLIYRLWYDSRR